MNKMIMVLLLPALLLPSMRLVAGGEEAQSAQRQARMIDSQAMFEEAERARQEASIAREGAMKAAELARETARMNSELAREEARRTAELARQDSQQNRQRSQELARERTLQNEELARTREELSRAHRELREATRQVARAHREIARTGMEHEITHRVNLGDRAVIGVVLGRQSAKGVEIIGVSPDGPAERAGLEPGDKLVAIGGAVLAGNDEGRESVFEIMQDVEDGQELAVTVDRDGDTLEYTVVAERREPRGWQSVIRLPEIASAEAAPGERRIVVETIEIPEFDEEALAAQVAELSEHLEAHKFKYITAYGDHMEDFELQIDMEEFSELGGQAMREANAWFGMPRAHGLQLAAVNEDLGAYFKTDRGVLVVKAKEGNAYQLESGDVILSIDSTEVDSPSDLMRALRDIEPGNEIEIEIMRDRKDRTIAVVMPENRLGHR